jgi:hypothetical protein
MTKQEYKVKFKDKTKTELEEMKFYEEMQNKIRWDYYNAIKELIKEKEE